MKKIAVTVAVLALGLAACGAKTDDAVENDTNVENAAEADVNAATTDATDWIVESDATTVVESNVATESRGMLSPVAAAASDESRDPADVSGFRTAASRACETSAGGSS
jgi:protein involved in sex pheromone biosynthesis